MLENRIASYYKFMYNVEMDWNKEHLDNGLPKIEDTIDFFKKLNLDVEIFYHGSCFLFEEMLQIETLTSDNTEAFRHWQNITEYYNRDIFYSDIASQKESIRNFIFYDKNIESMKKVINDLEMRFNENRYKIENFRRILYDFRDNLLIYKYNTGINDLKSKIEYMNSEYIEKNKKLMIQNSEILNNLEEMKLKNKAILDENMDLKEENENLRKEDENLRKENENLRKEIININEKALNIEACYLSVLNSKSWKYTRYFRKIKK